MPLSTSSCEQAACAIQLRLLQHFGSAIGAPNKSPGRTSMLTAFGSALTNGLPVELCGPARHLSFLLRASVRHTDASSTRFARVGRCDRRAAERPSSAARPAPGELWVRGSIIAGRVSCSGWFGRCSTLVAHVYLPSGDNHCPPCIRLRYVVELHHQTIACAGLAPGHDGVPSRSFSRLFQTRRKTPST
jgi:hypothetical protein